MSVEKDVSKFFFFKGVFICDLVEIESTCTIEELKSEMENYEKEISTEKHELRKAFKAFSGRLKRIIGEPNTTFEVDSDIDEESSKSKIRVGASVVKRNNETKINKFPRISEFLGINEYSRRNCDGIKKTEDKIIKIKLSLAHIRSGITMKMNVTTNSIDPFENCEGDFSIKPVSTNYTVIVPPGARDGVEVLRCDSKGDQELGCRRGDLVFIVSHALPNNVMLNGDDIHYVKLVSEEEENEGFEIKFPFYFSELKKRIEPKEIMFDRKIKIGSGNGLPDKNGLEYGDLYVDLLKEEKCKWYC